MNDLDNLKQNLYDYFQERYGGSTGSLGPGSQFLAFEKVPTFVAASDYKLNPGDTEFNAAVALQHGSRLVNFAVQIDPEGFIDPRGDLTPTVDGQYNLLLNAANPLAQSDGEAALFSQIKGQALQKFKDSEASMNLMDFWPAAFTPQFWFNDQDPGIWEHYAYAASQTTPPQPGTPPPVTLGEWRWRVITPEVATKWQSVAIAQALPAPVLVQSNFLDPQPLKVSPAAASPVASLEPQLSIKVEPSILLANLSSQAAEVPTSAGTAPPADTPVLQAAQLNVLNLKQAAFQEIILDLPEQPVSSSNFEISFDYCLVEVSRPWLSAEFLNMDNWYALGAQAGAYAGGSYAPSSLPFAYLPTKFIVVKDLSISAEWSEEDRASLQDAASLGPFSLMNKTISEGSGTLSYPGMQIIAWFCQIMPVLPPGTDPAIMDSGGGS